MRILLNMKYCNQMVMAFLYFLLLLQPISSHSGSSISLATNMRGYHTSTIPKATFVSSSRKFKVSNKRKKTSKQQIESSDSSTTRASSGQTVQEYDSDEGVVPTLSEMRASLGPIGRSIASAVEVGVVTAGSYLSGAVMGYTLGGVMSVPSLFQQSKEILPPPITLSKEIRHKVGTLHGKASTQAIQWATLSAAFSGFHALSRVVRGTEDKWNGIFGSLATGAYLNRKGGARAMAQGGISYASVTYLLDIAFGVSSGSGNKSGNTEDDSPEFQFTDAPLEE